MKKGVQFIFFCLISLQLFAQNDTIKIGQLLISKPESKSNLSWEQIIKNKDLNGLKVNFKKSNNNFKQLEELLNNRLLKQLYNIGNNKDLSDIENRLEKLDNKLDEEIIIDLQINA
jgi:hypothetical protein